VGGELVGNPSRMAGEEMIGSPFRKRKESLSVSIYAGGGEVVDDFSPKRRK